MTNEETLEKLRDILVEWFEVSPETVSENARLVEDLELDSLDVVDFVVTIEKTFRFKVVRSEDEPALKAARTLKDIIAFIHAKTRAKSS